MYFVYECGFFMVCSTFCDQSKPGVAGGYGGSAGEWNRQMGQQVAVVGQRGVQQQHTMQQARVHLPARGGTHQEHHGDYDGNQRSYQVQVHHGSPKRGARFTPPSGANSPVAAAQAAIRGSFQLRRPQDFGRTEALRGGMPMSATTSVMETQGGRAGTSVFSPTHMVSFGF